MIMDASAAHDDLHEHPDFDIHIKRVRGELRAVIWLFGDRHELEEVAKREHDEV